MFGCHLMSSSRRKTKRWHNKEIHNDDKRKKKMMSRLLLLFLRQQGLLSGTYSTTQYLILPSVPWFLVPGSVDLQYCYYLWYDYPVWSYLVPDRLACHHFWCTWPGTVPGTLIGPMNLLADVGPTSQILESKYLVPSIRENESYSNPFINSNINLCPLRNK